MNFRDQVTFRFITSHKGGQHTNGPDYGVLRCEHGLTGNAVELQTTPRLRQHQAREIAVTLLELAAAIDPTSAKEPTTPPSAEGS